MNPNINVLIDTISLFMVLIVFHSNVHHSERKQPAQQAGKGKRQWTLLNTLMICVSVVLLLDIPAWLLDGVTFRGARTVCMVLDTAYYLAQIVYCRLWLLFVDEWICGAKHRALRTRLLVSIPMCVEILLILTNVQTGWVFTLSSENVYARGALYGLNLGLYYFYILSAVGYATYSIYMSREQEKRRQNRSILVYMALPVCGSVIQAMNYGVSWLWPFAAISLLMVYMDMQSQKLYAQRVLAVREAARMAKLQNELANSRAKIMLSQVQPHFLYNSLSVIQALCQMDPALAAKATEDFAVYLRCNMDSLSSDQPIPFERELQHTKRYLSLEKLRFADALSIAFDIRTVDFQLPALTLQPLAENAVRYGITKRENGGSLLIATDETETGFVVIIRDKGAELDRTATGHPEIANVRQRLETMCGGTLTIRSEAGVGTEAIIVIPKSRAGDGTSHN